MRLLVALVSISHVLSVTVVIRSWFDRREEDGGGFSRRVIWNAVHDLAARGYLGLSDRQSGYVEWWVNARLGMRGGGRLRYLELIAGGRRDNLDVETPALIVAGIGERLFRSICEVEESAENSVQESDESKAGQGFQK
jgi:hypothetical protein